MESLYKNFILKVIDEPNYTPNSMDNVNHYERKYLEDECAFGNVHGIYVFQASKEISSAIISSSGGKTTIHETSYLIKNNSIFICCGDSIYSLHIPHLTLNWIKKLDFATCFQLFEFEKDFIVHGETQITRITIDGEIQWDFSARDIFITQNGNNAIEISGDTILLTDWENYKYVLNKNGVEIS